MISVFHYDSPIGKITVSAEENALTGLWFDGQKYDRDLLTGQEYREETLQEEALPVFRETERWLELYFSGRDPGFTPPLRLSGSGFRRLVAEIMLTIPYGKTLIYGEIAEKAAGRLGKSRMSAQAVGGAVGHNSISLIVPCHRVVGRNGSLTGYAGGIEKKRYLLELEGVSLTEAGLFIPKNGTAL